MICHILKKKKINTLKSPFMDSTGRVTVLFLASLFSFALSFFDAQSLVFFPSLLFVLTLNKRWPQVVHGQEGHPYPDSVGKVEKQREGKAGICSDPMTRPADVRKHQEIRHSFPHRHNVHVVRHQPGMATGLVVLIMIIMILIIIIIR